MDATFTIPASATAGKHYSFKVASAASGVSPAGDIETIMVGRSSSPSPKPSSTPAGGGGATPGAPGSGSTLTPASGVGATLPVGLGVANGVATTPALGSLPGPTAGASDPAVTFPTIGPSLAPSPVALPGPQRARVANVSAEFPLDGRLIGIQVGGLAALAAAVTIAVARLSLRRRAPRHSREAA